MNEKIKSHLVLIGDGPERSNSEKIENIGVIPDVEYELTIEDVRKGYQDYKKAVNKTVKDLLENLQTSDF